MAATKKTPDPAPGSVLFAGWPNKTIDAGELGIIQFDADATAVITQAQADWLAGQIASGALPEAEAAPGEALPELTETVAGEEKQADLAACNKQLFDGWASNEAGKPKMPTPAVEQIHDPST